MDEAWQQQVRERAYAIWQREGSPDGSAEQFWLIAEEELLAEGHGPSSGRSEERPDRPDEAAGRRHGRRLVPGQRPAGLDQRNRGWRAQRREDTEAVLAGCHAAEHRIEPGLALGVMTGWIRCRPPGGEFGLQRLDTPTLDDGLELAAVGDDHAEPAIRTSMIR